MSIKATQSLTGSVVIGRPLAEVKVSEVDGGYKITVTDPNGSQELILKNGTFEDLTEEQMAAIANKVTPDGIGAVPDTRKINNNPLGTDVSLTASDVSATPWTLAYADTFDSFWDSICTAAGNMGIVAFRAKDTGGWGPTKATNTWLNGVAFWQNPHTGNDDVNGTIILRLHSTSNSALYKGFVSGNKTSGYTLEWHKMYDTNNKPTPAEIGLKTETLTLTLGDGSTVTKELYVK